MSWYPEIDKLLYQIESNLFIVMTIMYDSANNYRFWSRMTGWPPTMLSALMAMIQSANFVEMVDWGKTTINIVTVVLSVLITIFTTIHNCLDYSAQSRRCIDTHGNISDLYWSIKETRNIPIDKRESQRGSLEAYLQKLRQKMAKFEKDMPLVSNKIIRKYYPDNVADLKLLFDTFEKNGPLHRLEIDA
jgi:low affinity Fe/Cu permease